MRVATTSVTLRRGDLCTTARVGGEHSGTQILAHDAAASVDVLAAHPAVDPDRVGVIGMSQDGRIAPLVADHRDHLAYAVSLVGGVLPAHDSLQYEEVHNLRELGFLPGVTDVLAHASSRLTIAGTQRQFWAAVGNFDPLPHRAATDADLPILSRFGGKDANTESVRVGAPPCVIAATERADRGL